MPEIKFFVSCSDENEIRNFENCYPRVYNPKVLDWLFGPEDKLVHNVVQKDERYTDAHIRQLVKWLKENCTEDSYVVINRNAFRRNIPSDVYFDSNDDAMLFKLSFG